jgi:Flp pilus assembly protein TadG
MEGKPLKRFLRSQKGAPALEFALVAAPFVLLFMGILETALVFFANAELENGMRDVARQIRTGQIRSDQLSAAELKDRLCAELSSLLACDASLAIDVRPFGGFGDVDFSNPLDEDGNLQPTFEFDTGKPSDVVLARAFYKWKIVTPILGGFLANMSDNERLLTASFAFRNEPY